MLVAAIAIVMLAVLILGVAGAVALICFWFSNNL